MKYYIITGEASGDLHASNLVKALKKLDTDASFRGWGGERMRDAGTVVVRHYRDLAFMGFLEVAINILTIISNFRFCKRDILLYRPDVVILVDYPGFNLRIARYLHQKNIRVFYYISPQLWAWRPSRLKTIKACVDRMFVILPFEKEFYKNHDYQVDFVGHPLLDVINEQQSLPDRRSFLLRNELSDKPIVALLPGSREQEIIKMLKVMSAVSRGFPEYQFVIGGVPTVLPHVYSASFREGGLPVVFEQTYNLLKHSVAALVTSGTATLETALMNIPQVVCYKGSYFSFQIARQVVHVKFISLVNLITDKEIVKELIQDQVTSDNLAANLKKILPGTPGREIMLRDYEILRDRLGGTGASARTAELMIQYLAKI